MGLREIFMIKTIVVQEEVYVFVFWKLFFFLVLQLACLVIQSTATSQNKRIAQLLKSRLCKNIAFKMKGKLEPISVIFLLVHMMIRSSIQILRHMFQISAQFTVIFANFLS